MKKLLTEKRFSYLDIIPITIIGFILKFLIFGSSAIAAPAPAAYSPQQPAAIITTIERDGWRYDLTDETYTDARLPYAIEGARLYWGHLPENFRVLVMNATPISAERDSVAIGIWAPVSLDDKGAIWINRAYFGARVGGKLATNRATLCLDVTHEVGHAEDPNPELGAHRADYPGDVDHVMLGNMPHTCVIDSAQDRERKARKWCKQNKKRCIRTRPALARRTLKHI